MMKWILAIVLGLLAGSGFAACSGSGTSWTCTAGSTITNVNSAISSGSDGMTITFASGSYTWTSGEIAWPNTKGVSMVCEVEAACDVSVGSNSFISMQGTISGTNNRRYRFSGFDVTHNGTGTPLSIWLYGTGTLNNLRIDHNRFMNYAVSSIVIFIGSTETETIVNGVIDHNTFSGPNNFMSMKYLSADPETRAASVRGTRSNMFLENNTYTFTDNSDLGSGCIDVWQGGAVVVRYNDTTNCLWTAHGVSHGGVINFEFYGNILRRTSGVTWADCTRAYHHQGSGEMFIFQNTFHCIGSIAGSAIDVTHYRSAPPATAGYSTTLDRCDGASTGLTDGNVLANGWPCWFQPGRMPNGGSPAYGSLSPIYVWQNVNNANGAKVDLSVSDPWSAGAPTPQDHVAANRDYYNAVSATAQTSSTSPFNGTTGMGFGTYARRPTTCSTGTDPESSGKGGVGYYATDTKVLYRCTAGNVWVRHYIPYVYPHPLVSGKPAPPMNIRITEIEQLERLSIDREMTAMH